MNIYFRLDDILYAEPLSSILKLSVQVSFDIVRQGNSIIIKEALSIQSLYYSVFSNDAQHTKNYFQND